MIIRGKVQYVRAWNVATGKQISAGWSAAGADHPMILISPDGRIIARTPGPVGSGRITLREVATGRLRAHLDLDRHDRDIYGIAFSPDIQTLASAGKDGTVRLWNVRSGKEIARLNGPRRVGVKAVVFSPDGQTLVSGGLDKKAHLWDVRRFTTRQPRKKRASADPNARQRQLNQAAEKLLQGRPLGNAQQRELNSFWEVAMRGAELKKPKKPLKKKTHTKAGIPNYIIVPITTELQQVESPGNDTLACVLINWDFLLKAGGPTRDDLDLTKLRNELAKWPNRQNGSVYLLPMSWDPQLYGQYVRGKAPVGKSRKTGFAETAFMYALEGVGRVAGFREAYTLRGPILYGQRPTQKVGDHHPQPGSWKELLAGIKTDLAAIRAGKRFYEPGIGDDFVTVYPVRTQLAALLCEAQDCMIHIDGVSPYGKTTVERAKQLPDLIERYVAAARLTKKRHVIVSNTLFWYLRPVYWPDKGWWHSPPDITPGYRKWSASEAGKELNRQYTYVLSKAFMRKLGFRRRSLGEVYRYVPSQQRTGI